MMNENNLADHSKDEGPPHSPSPTNGEGLLNGKNASDNGDNNDEDIQGQTTTETGKTSPAASGGAECDKDNCGDTKEKDNGLDAILKVSSENTPQVTDDTEGELRDCGGDKETPGNETGEEIDKKRQASNVGVDQPPQSIGRESEDALPKSSSPTNGEGLLNGDNASDNRDSNEEDTQGQTTADTVIDKIPPAASGGAECDKDTCGDIKEKDNGLDAKLKVPSENTPPDTDDSKGEGRDCGGNKERDNESGPKVEQNISMTPGTDSGEEIDKKRQASHVGEDNVEASITHQNQECKLGERSEHEDEPSQAKGREAETDHEVEGNDAKDGVEVPDSAGSDSTTPPVTEKQDRHRANPREDSNPNSIEDSDRQTPGGDSSLQHDWSTADQPNSSTTEGHDNHSEESDTKNKNEGEDIINHTNPAGTGDQEGQNSKLESKSGENSQMNTSKTSNDKIQDPGPKGETDGGSMDRTNSHKTGNHTTQNPDTETPHDDAIDQTRSSSTENNQRPELDPKQRKLDDLYNKTPSDSSSEPVLKTEKSSIPESKDDKSQPVYPDNINDASMDASNVRNRQTDDAGDDKKKIKNSKDAVASENDDGNDGNMDNDVTEGRDLDERNGENKSKDNISNVTVMGGVDNDRPATNHQDVETEKRNDDVEELTGFFGKLNMDEKNIDGNGEGYNNDGKKQSAQQAHSTRPDNSCGGKKSSHLGNERVTEKSQYLNPEHIYMSTQIFDRLQEQGDLWKKMEEKIKKHFVRKYEQPISYSDVVQLKLEPKSCKTTQADIDEVANEYERLIEMVKNSPPKEDTRKEADASMHSEKKDENHQHTEDATKPHMETVDHENTSKNIIMSAERSRDAAPNNRVTGPLDSCGLMRAEMANKSPDANSQHIENISEIHAKIVKVKNTSDQSTQTPEEEREVRQNKRKISTEKEKLLKNEQPELEKETPPKDETTTAKTNEYWGTPDCLLVEQKVYDKIVKDNSSMLDNMKKKYQADMVEKRVINEEGKFVLFFTKNFQSASASQEDEMLQKCHSLIKILSPDKPNAAEPMEVDEVEVEIETDDEPGVKTTSVDTYIYKYMKQNMQNVLTEMSQDPHVKFEKYKETDTQVTIRFVPRNKSVSEDKIGKMEQKFDQLCTELITDVTLKPFPLNKDQFPDLNSVMKAWEKEIDNQPVVFQIHESGEKPMLQIIGKAKEIDAASEKLKHLGVIKPDRPNARRLLRDNNEPQRDEMNKNLDLHYDHVQDKHGKLTFTTRRGIKVMIYREDLVKQTTYAIVNAANEKLGLGGGVAGAIYDAAGDEMQEYCNHYIRNHGPVKVGEVASTGACGKLKCKAVIHAVGPRRREHSNEKELLKNAILNSILCCNKELKENERESMRGISIPAISSGLFCVEMTTVLWAFREAIFEFDDMIKNGFINCVKDIHLVNIDQKTTDALKSYFREEIANFTKRQATNPEIEGGRSSNSREGFGHGLGMQSRGREIAPHNWRHQDEQRMFDSMPESYSGQNQAALAHPRNQNQVHDGYRGQGSYQNEGRMFESTPGSYANAVSGGDSSTFGSNGIRSQGSTQTKLTAKPEGRSDDKDDQCCICIDTIQNPKVLPCKHSFCKECIDNHVKFNNPICPACLKPFGKIIGNQPPGTCTMTNERSIHLSGYGRCGSIRIQYYIPGGIQTDRHPNPGEPYYYTSRTAYLPSNDEGRDIANLLRKAFDEGHIFTVGRSVTNNTDNCVVWNDIHHKTVISGSAYGYPDANYLKRVREELRAKGIVSKEGDKKFAKK